MTKLSNDLYINENQIATAQEVIVKTLEGNDITTYVITFSGGFSLNISEDDFNTLVGNE